MSGADMSDTVPDSCPKPMMSKPRLIETLKAPLPIAVTVDAVSGRSLVVGTVQLDDVQLERAIRARLWALPWDAELQPKLARIMAPFIEPRMATLKWPDDDALLAQLVQDTIAGISWLTGMFTRLNLLAEQMSVEDAITAALDYVTDRSRLCHRCGGMFVPTRSRKVCGLPGCGRPIRRQDKTVPMRERRARGIYADFEAIYRKELGQKAKDPRRIFDRLLAGDRKVEDHLETAADTSPEVGAILRRVLRYRSILERDGRLPE